MKIDTAFITGTGFYTLPGLETLGLQKVRTPYGEVELEVASLAGREIVFLPRHGKQHGIAPRQINYRANICALKELGVRRILSTSVCGSLRKDLAPNALVLIDQFINFTHGREDTFYPLDGKLVHIDVTDPYCGTLHAQLLAGAKRSGIELKKGATYACWDGPRFETRAEIRMTRVLGGDLVGQTNYPECVLAREMAICYATVGVVSNYAAGMSASISVADIMENLKKTGGKIAALFSQFLMLYPEPADCTCQHALDGAAL